MTRPSPGTWKPATREPAQVGEGQRRRAAVHHVSEPDAIGDLAAYEQVVSIATLKRALAAAGADEAGREEEGADQGAHAVG